MITIIMSDSKVNPPQKKKNEDTCPVAKSFRVLFAVTMAMLLILVYGCYMNTDITGAYYDTTFNHPLSLLAHKNLSRSPKKSPLPSNGSGPIILLWTSRYSETGSWLPQPSTLGCSVSDCVITTDRKLLSASATVIFHVRSVNMFDLPRRHDPNQRWVLFNREAPPHTPKNILEKLSGKINWTVTYRKDSDIYAPYGYIVRRKVPVTIMNPPTGRRLVCWLVSNCNTPSGRERYVEILKQFIPVDVYGKCGDLQCSVEDRLGCYRELSKKYKFYLSFENSICKDYATEKLFNALSTDMVPVVMGGEEYRQVLPSKSYIDALSFEGPEQLAKYLRMLDEDDGKYLSYLAWKKDYDVVRDDFQWSCELCRMLHYNDTKTHNDLKRWWFHSSLCSSWSQRVASQ